jgi:hypothetical protein
MINKENRFVFWRKVLLAANILTAAVGLYIAAFPEGELLKTYNSYLGETFLLEEPGSQVLEMKNWLFGVLGGTILGFHILMIFIIVYPLKRKEKWAYFALWAGMLSWFLVDTASSFFYSAYFNVILINLFAITVNVIPLLFLRKFIFRPN